MNKNESEEDYDCLHCPIIDCLNLFTPSEDSKNIGKELYVYNLVGEEVEKDQTFGYIVVQLVRYYTRYVS